MLLSIIVSAGENACASVWLLKGLQNHFVSCCLCPKSNLCPDEFDDSDVVRHNSSFFDAKFQVQGVRFQVPFFLLRAFHFYFHFVVCIVASSMIPHSKKKNSSESLLLHNHVHNYFQPPLLTPIQQTGPRWFQQLYIYWNKKHQNITYIHINEPIHNQTI